MDWCRVENKLRDARLFLVRTLPSATLMSFLFTDATGGCPGGVLDRPLLYVTARPATKAPVTALLLTRSSLHGAPQWTRTDQQRTYRNPCCTWYADYVPTGHLTDCEDGVANEQARGGVRLV